MKLSGQQIEQLRDALISAFPEQSKLEQFIRFKFSQNLYAIAMGSDLEYIVFKLIETAESQGWVDKLISASYTNNPGNQELQQFIKQHIPSPSLFQILTPLEENFISQMKQAYLDCCSDNLQKSYTQDGEPIPGSVINILIELNDFNELRTRKIESNHYNGIVQFVARLLLSLKEKFSQKTVEELRNWANQKEDEFSNLENYLKNENKVSIAAKNTSLSTYLLIQLKESNQQNKKTKQYNVSAWFIPDGRNHKIDIIKARYDGYIPLEISDKQQNFTLKKVSQFIEECIKEINEKGYRISKHSLMIMLFLPLKILLKEPIDCLPIQESKILSLGSEYQILFRHNERLNKFVEDWNRKWESVEEDEHSNVNTILYEDCQNEELIIKIKTNPKLVCVKLVQPPSKEIMTIIERESIPVIVWLRKSIENSSYQQDLNNLKKGKISELPNRVKQKRLEAINDKTKQHIGHHLTLIWENPYLLPPDTNFQYKIAE